MLDLTKVEYKIISADDFDKRKWTPKIFSEEANKLFNVKIKN
jgi:desulfoferrodoxin (superoxide reductase-like protein)